MEQLAQAQKRGIFFYPLKQISVQGGDVFHGLKKSDSGFVDFGEVYFSFIEAGKRKGWKKHNRMSLNLMVPIGEVNFFIHDEQLSKTIRIRVGQSNYGRLSIKPGLWVAFEGAGHRENLVTNVASIEHDPQEAEQRDQGFFSFDDYISWSDLL